MKQGLKNGLELLFYLLLAGIWYFGQYQAWDHTYVDTDNYYHALRLTALLENPSYFEQRFMLGNYPFGEVLHWTKALDVFWGILTLPFLTAYPLKTAVFYAGMLIAPLFFILAIIAWNKAARLFISLPYRALWAILVAVQANVMREVFLNRPDHHAAFVFLTAWLLLYMWRFIQNNSQRDLTIAALICAFSLFMAVEGVFLAVGVLLFLGYAWLFMQFDLQNIRRFLGFYTLGIAVFLLFNPPYEGFLSLDTGRISLFYLMLSLGGYGAVLVGEKMKNTWQSLGVMVGIIGILFVLLSLMGAFSSPLDEHIRTIFVSRISEMRPGNFYTLTYSGLGVLFSLFLWKKNQGNGCFIYLMLNIFLFFALSCYTSHFLPYAGFYAAGMLAYAVSVMKYKKMLSVCFVLAEYISFTILALTTKIEPLQTYYEPITELRSLPFGAVVTDIFIGPSIVWQTGKPIVASPYHRNVEGIVDTHKIFFSADEKEVIALLKKHKVSYIYLPDAPYDEEYYVEPAKNLDKLYGKILTQTDVPAWLKPLPVEAGHLYKINFNFE